MSAYKVVITDFGDSDNEIEADVLRASGLDINLVRLNTRAPEELIPLVVDADALIVQWATINRKVIESLQRCQVISRYGIGVDMVDLQAAGEHGIPVANVPDFCWEEVSTQTIGFIIDLNRHTVPFHQFVASGKWGVGSHDLKPPTRLSRQTAGVIGLGNIGRAVAQKAGCLGMQVVAHDPYVNPDRADVEMLSLDDLLRRSDYVCVHCPLVDETRGLIGAAQLALMKPTAYLINMARGPVVKQAELYEALVKGVIAGAALDVLEKEPPSPDDPLLKLPNVVLAPHASSWSTDAVLQLRHDTAQNVVDVLCGKGARSVVNRKWLRR